MGIILQAVLAKNYPKVRKGLYVFPINWWVYFLQFISFARVVTDPMQTRDGPCRGDPRKMSAQGVPFFEADRYWYWSGLCSCFGTRC